MSLSTRAVFVYLSEVNSRIVATNQIFRNHWAEVTDRRLKDNWTQFYMNWRNFVRSLFVTGTNGNPVDILRMGDIGVIENWAQMMTGGTYRLIRRFDEMLRGWTQLLRRQIPSAAETFPAAPELPPENATVLDPINETLKTVAIIAGIVGGIFLFSKVG